MKMLMVDINEKATNPKQFSILEKAYPKLVLGNLMFGDINAILDNGSLLSIERKKVEDFLASIADNRVFKQVEEMSNGSQYYGIIMIGSLEFSPEDDVVIANGRKTNWKGSAVRAAMFALQWSGCPIAYINSPTLLPQTINEFVNICEKPKEHLHLKHNRIITFPPVDQRVQILASLFPSVGMKRAQSLLEFTAEMEGVEEEGEKYGKLSSAISYATLMPLIPRKKRPEGWGDSLVATIRTILGLKDDEYLDIVKEGDKSAKSE